jgi:hypothetical protein
VQQHFPVLTFFIFAEAELDALGDMDIEEEPPAWLSNMPSVEQSQPDAVPAQPTAIQLK